VTDLRPETNYVFLVRAENSHGLSLPGPLSDVVQTTNVNQHTVPQVELTRARDRLNSEILHLKEVQPLSSTSVKIMWDVSHVDLNISRFLDTLLNTRCYKIYERYQRERERERERLKIV